MKDAQGHGSNTRGGSSATDALAKQVAFTKAAGASMTPAQKAWLVHAEGRLAAAGQGEPRVGGPGMKGAAMGSKSSDYWAAKSLAGDHPKSAPVATHAAFLGVPESSIVRTPGWQNFGK
jgi:hypothetical protein